MGWFTNFVSELTGDSSSKVSEGHHQARDDSGVRDGKDSEHFEHSPSDGQQTTESGIPFYPDR